jgi:hypothetical protein
MKRYRILWIARSGRDYWDDIERPSLVEALALLLKIRRVARFVQAWRGDECVMGDPLDDGRRLERFLNAG